jgi:hypothetical protein
MASGTTRAITAFPKASGRNRKRKIEKEVTGLQVRGYVNYLAGNCINCDSTASYQIASRPTFNIDTPGNHLCAILFIDDIQGRIGLDRFDIFELAGSYTDRLAPRYF